MLSSRYNMTGILLTHSNCDSHLYKTEPGSILSWRGRGSGYEKTGFMGIWWLLEEGKTFCSTV